MTVQELIGYIAAFFTMIAFLPQVIKSVQSRDTRDISYGLLILQSSGCLLWSVYGMMGHSYPILIANFTTFLLVVFVLMIKLRVANIKKL
jgi:MtN3 and saliva related transmembrane protein